MNPSFVLCSFLVSLPAAAQQPPALRPPPARAAWEISYKSDLSPKVASQNPGAVASQAPAEVKSREYTVNGELGKCVSHYSDGKSVTIYTMSQVAVGENPQDTTDLVVDDLSSSWMAGGEFRKNYPGLAWVRPDLYKGVVEFRGVSCHFFAEAEAAAESASAAPSGMAPDPRVHQPRGLQAWFDMDGRPLAYKDRNITATFTHKPADSVPPVEVPERFLAKAKRYLDSLAPKTLPK